MSIFSDLNPLKHIKDGFESITGVADQRRAINAANRAQQESILQAITGLQQGGNQAAKFLKTGANKSRDFISGGGAFDANEYGQGLTLQGYGNQLAQISDPNGMFAPLFQQRQTDARNMLGAAGLTRSGNAAEAAANIPMELAMGISDKMFGRQSNTAGALAGLETDLYGNLANIDLAEAMNIASLQTGAGNANAQAEIAKGSIESPFASIFQGLAGNAISGGISAITGGGMGGAALGGITSLLGFLSDERLKTNMQIIGRDGDLTFYSWEWIPEVQELDLPLMTVGLIAQDVEKVAPEYVFQIGELKAINYDELFKDPRWSTLQPQ